MAKIKLTKKFIESQPLSETGSLVFWDTVTSGFGIKFTIRYRTYIVQRKLHGKSKRITIGRHGIITLDQARKQAGIEYGKLSAGIDPNAEKKKALQQEKREAVEATTLAQAYDRYRKDKDLKPNTLRDYDRAIFKTLATWNDKPLIHITPDMVQKRHAALAKKTPALANLTFRALRAVLNHAMEVFTLPNGDYLLSRNPVSRLSIAKAWKKIPPRQNSIKPHQLNQWFQAIDQLENQTTADYLKFVLLTGLRRENAASLKWESIDFQDRSFTVLPKAKASPVTLPLTNYLLDLLKARQAATASQFVFPGEGTTGHIAEPKRALQRVHTITGIKTTIHDLRRSYSRFAKLLKVPADIVKNLLAHSVKSDVTQEHYTGQDVEFLRDYAQRITDYILTQSKIKPGDKVVPLHKTVG